MNRTETTTTRHTHPASQRQTTLGRSAWLRDPADSKESVLPPWERITLIHDFIETGTYPNASTLAVALRLSRTTVARDLAYMRDHLGLPLQYDGLRWGYFYAAPAIARPHPISEVDLFALLVGGRAMSQVRGTQYETDMRAFLRRILGTFKPEAYLSISDLRSCMSIPGPRIDPDAVRQFVAKALSARIPQTLN
jgi:hypothetical protein